MTVCRNAAELRFRGGAFTFAMGSGYSGAYRLSRCIYRLSASRIQREPSLSAATRSEGFRSYGVRSTHVEIAWLSAPVGTPLQTFVLRRSASLRLNKKPHKSQTKSHLVRLISRMSHLAPIRRAAPSP